jgi:vacuolar-type H+-ATPase subunit E/Vma4
VRELKVDGNSIKRKNEEKIEEIYCRFQKQSMKKKQQTKMT